MTFYKYKGTEPFYLVIRNKTLYTCDMARTTVKWRIDQTKVDKYLNEIIQSDYTEVSEKLLRLRGIPKFSK